MFGSYRLLLAVLVVVDHNFGVGVTSTTAVGGFFCLSGFLMTHLVTKPYRGRVGAFFLNRFLRIYPLYWITMFGLIAYIRAPIALDWPFLKQVLLFNRPGEGLYILPSWAVTLELAFYVLIGLGISATLWRSLIWFVLSLTTTFGAFAYLTASGHSDLLTYLYFSIWSGSLPFALGALTYHLSTRWAYRAGPALALGGGTMVGATAIASLGFHYWHSIPLMMLGIYASMAAQVPILMTLFRAPVSRYLRAWDDWLGSFSYPLYLVHMVVYSIATDRHVISPVMSIRNGAIVLVLSIAAAWILSAIIDTPVQMLRRIVRRAQFTPAYVSPLSPDLRGIGRQDQIGSTPRPDFT